MEEKDRKRMIQCFGYSTDDRSMKRWKDIASRRKVIRNYVLMVSCKALPDIELKNMLYRKTGVKIGKNVRIFGSNMDIFFPELIEIGDNTMIGNKTSILTHEFLRDGWRKGPVKIGKDAVIGTVTLILPGVTIGDGATVAAYSLVNRDVSPGETVGGVPIKGLARRIRGVRRTP
jgi:acetyltransferase-like isoleucine patch superfamily enzyme